jgi:hypothetical protein
VEKRIGNGKAGPGRPKGRPNKTTASAKEAFALAFEEMGGYKALMAWGKKNPNNFYPLFAKLIPIDLNASVDMNTTTIVRRELKSKADLKEKDA